MKHPYPTQKGLPVFELLFLTTLLACGIGLAVSGHRDEARNR